MLRVHKSRGQALVEFALAATLIFFLLAAAVDLGFMFFAMQGLHNAAQEGGTYGSRWLVSNVTTGARTLDVNVIRDNVRHESGSRGGIGFVNLLDLNNDGTPDINPDGPIAQCTPAKCQVNPATGNYVVNDFIQIYTINDTNLNGDPLDDGTAPNYPACANASSSTCFINVVVSFNYRLVFPLSPTFTRERTLRSSFTMRLRDDMARSGVSATAPVFATITPTPQNMSMTLLNFYFDPTTVNPRKFSVKAFVTLNGAALDTALVNGEITRGGTKIPVTLASIGNGLYTACNVGSVNGNGPTPSVSLTATNSTGASASASSSNPSNTTKFVECP